MQEHAELATRIVEAWCDGGGAPSCYRVLADRFPFLVDDLRNEMVQALLLVEWMSVGPQVGMCSACPAWKVHGHHKGCPIDGALTNAWLADQTSRDEARRLMVEAAR